MFVKGCSQIRWSKGREEAEGHETLQGCGDRLLWSAMRPGMHGVVACVLMWVHRWLHSSERRDQGAASSSKIEYSHLPGDQQLPSQPQSGSSCLTKLKQFQMLDCLKDSSLVFLVLIKLVFFCCTLLKGSLCFEFVGFANTIASIPSCFGWM